jgi:actin-related protein 10
MAATGSAPTRRPTSTTEPRPSTRPSSSYIVGATPHYTTTRRHSLYGTEDRIIIDPGSKFWKVGFGGEGKPRHVYDVCRPGEDSPLWGSSAARTPEEYEEADRMLSARLQDVLRAVFFEQVSNAGVQLLGLMSN